MAQQWSALLHGKLQARALEIFTEVVQYLSVDTAADPTFPPDPADLALLHAYGTRAFLQAGSAAQGVAHGVPGVIGLLASICAARMAPARAWTLLEGAVEWLLAQRRPEDESGCSASYTGPDIKPNPARPAPTSP